jgi:hypothetical protein
MFGDEEAGGSSSSPDILMRYPDKGHLRFSKSFLVALSFQVPALNHGNQILTFLAPYPVGKNT